MRYGIFGGSFDPVHLGHLLLAEAAREHCGLNHVIFVPAGRPPHKQDSQRTPGEIRAQMLEIVLGEFEEYSVSHYEIERHEVGYTVDTLRHFKETLLDAELFLILGADMFNDLPYWKDTAEILRLATPVVAFRPGHTEPYFEALVPFVSQERLFSFHDFQVPMPAIEISATEIRNRCAQGRSIRFMLPRILEKFIKTHGVYGEDLGFRV